MEATAIVKASILKDKTTKVSVRGDNVVRLFFLSKFIAIVQTFLFRGFTNQRTRDQRAMHGREQSPTKYAGNTQHMERMHKNIMFSLKNEHEVERTGNAKRHAV